MMQKIRYCDNLVIYKHNLKLMLLNFLTNIKILKIVSQIIILVTILEILFYLL